MRWSGCFHRFQSEHLPLPGRESKTPAPLHPPIFARLKHCQMLSMFSRMSTLLQDQSSNPNGSIWSVFCSLCDPLLNIASSSPCFFAGGGGGGGGEGWGWGVGGVVFTRYQAGPANSFEEAGRGDKGSCRSTAVNGRMVCIWRWRYGEHMCSAILSVSERSIFVFVLFILVMEEGAHDPNPLGSVMSSPPTPLYSSSQPSNRWPYWCVV